MPIGKEDSALAKLKNAGILTTWVVYFLIPSLENNFISLTQDSNGSPTFTYKDNSTLKKLVSALEEKVLK